MIVAENARIEFAQRTTRGFGRDNRAHAAQSLLQDV